MSDADEYNFEYPDPYFCDCTCDHDREDHDRDGCTVEGCDCKGHWED
jgi:hypothetical protein